MTSNINKTQIVSNYVLEVYTLTIIKDYIINKLGSLQSVYCSENMGDIIAILDDLKTNNIQCRILVKRECTIDNKIETFIIHEGLINCGLNISIKEYTNVVKDILTTNKLYTNAIERGLFKTEESIMKLNENIKSEKAKNDGCKDKYILEFYSLSEKEPGVLKRSHNCDLLCDVVAHLNNVLINGESFKFILKKEYSIGNEKEIFMIYADKINFKCDSNRYNIIMKNLHSASELYDTVVGAAQRRSHSDFDGDLLHIAPIKMQPVYNFNRLKKRLEGKINEIKDLDTKMNSLIESNNLFAKSECPICIKVTKDIDVTISIVDTLDLGIKKIKEDIGKCNDEIINICKQIALCESK